MLQGLSPCSECFAAARLPYYSCIDESRLHIRLSSCRTALCHVDWSCPGHALNRAPRLFAIISYLSFWCVSKHLDKQLDLIRGFVLTGLDELSLPREEPLCSSGTGG